MCRSDRRRGGRYYCSVMGNGFLDSSCLSLSIHAYGLSGYLITMYPVFFNACIPAPPTSHVFPFFVILCSFLAMFSMLFVG